MCSLHNASGPISCAASVQVSATMSNFLILEYAWGSPAWRAELCREPELLDDGCFTLSSTPGLGMDLDLRTLERYSLSKSVQRAYSFPNAGSGFLGIDEQRIEWWSSQLQSNPLSSGTRRARPLPTKATTTAPFVEGLLRLQCNVQPCHLRCRIAGSFLARVETSSIEKRIAQFL